MVPQAAFRAKAPWICYPSPMRSALVRYHEIALKRGNRGYFVEHPKKNLGLVPRRGRTPGRTSGTRRQGAP